MFWFAASYGFFANEFDSNISAIVATLTGSFYFSILTMATYGDIAPQTTFGRWLVTWHLLISIFLTIGVLGRLVSVLPRPRPRDKAEE
jgi:voltage-gated potassium channel Kch